MEVYDVWDLLQNSKEAGKASEVSTHEIRLVMS